MQPFFIQVVNDPDPFNMSNKCLTPLFVDDSLIR